MADLAQACLYPSSATTSADWPHPASVAQVPTFDMLQQTLATTKCAKAPGFDQIPPEMCKYFPHEVATVLFPLLLKQVWRGCEAIGWKGGQSVYFYKQKGSMQECGSYRAVLLLSAFAKACHKSLRPPLKCLYEQHAPSFQLGGRRGCSVTFGSHLVRGVQRWACARGLTAFTIFADIASAFYGAITQLVAASGGQPSPDALQRITAKLQLNVGDIEALKRHLAEPSETQHLQADPWLEAVTDRMSCQNWFIVKHDSVPVATSRGTRPGSSFADIVFALLVPKVLRSRDAARADTHSASQRPLLPWDGRRTLAACDAAAGEIPIGEVIWADDLAVPRVCTDPCSTRAALACETGLLADSLSEFGLRLSYGAGKTAAVVSVRGNGSKAVKQPCSLTTSLPVRCPSSVSMRSKQGYPW